MRGLKQESWWEKIQNNHQMSIIIMNHQSDVHDIHYAEFGFDRSSGLCKRRGFNIPTQFNGTISEPTQVHWIAMDAVHSNGYFLYLAAGEFASLSKGAQAPDNLRSNCLTVVLP